MVHHDKSSNHQFPKKLLIMLLIIFLMLYITFLWLITTGGLDLLVSFYLFHSSLSPLGNSSLSSIPLSLFSFLFFFSPFIYLFLLYNIVLVLPYINMNPPQVNTCSQSWTPLPHPSPSHPSGSSQCTSPKLPVSCIEPGLAIHFLYDIIHVLMPFSQIILLSLSHRVQKTVLYICVSFAVLHIELSLPCNSK